MPKQFYIETYGCQMNVYDSACISSLLSKAGMTKAGSPEQADAVIINSCAVRGHAEERALGRVAELKGIKSQKPGLKLVLCGCVAQEQGPALLEHYKHLDAALGTKSYAELPAILTRLFADDLQQCRNDIGIFTEETGLIPDFKNQATAHLAIMRGCNNYCSYCIVPYVRGPESSRPAPAILEEMEKLSRQGILEVTLVGQNVNSYHWQEVNFPELLHQACRVGGLERIRFITSHPKDLSDDLIAVMAEQPRVCKHLHLPLQAGSDRILALMNRGYTAEHFISLITKARQAMPGLVLTTDIIAGFPGETEGEFNETLEVAQKIGFDAAFTYKYSERPGTKACGLEGKIPDPEKKNRLNRLIKRQQQITIESNRADIGKTYEVLVEKKSKRSHGQFMGRTNGNKTVAFHSKSKIKPGEMVNVKIQKATQATLVGETV
ncbi:tRNA (N6-isopentenyl adenosine(37)-C2)-methylthiotransferase MiaB [candidate division TA06 bacterium]|uniref:tRNA-2-methylthio-N(6)-dimethylallyladenosine synthase n=1 Tax=candidate division TA06 bacterium TaxID=2250710 RepID=A0A933I8T4_UNCT6|nr:tRNA (N6-isopentenyl adenosine(37)-C2)-methylthiotransferase MiaB [candidate division TA06 bacterium]